MSGIPPFLFTLCEAIKTRYVVEQGLSFGGVYCNNESSKKTAAGEFLQFLSTRWQNQSGNIFDIGKRGEWRSRHFENKCTSLYNDITTASLEKKKISKYGI